MIEEFYFRFSKYPSILIKEQSWIRETSVTCIKNQYILHNNENEEKEFFLLDYNIPIYKSILSSENLAILNMKNNEIPILLHYFILEMLKNDNKIEMITV